ncbi:MAG TPA: right-handed parallel beta-helix repeat-containing protein, partial [Minicystis sp.]|nr:right-handed parallel beta-helix repeat-containing protein [Minicystis sp.]
QGFVVAGSNDDMGTSPHGPNAGIFLDGDFGNSTREAHHLAIVGVFSHHHHFWGLHSTDTHTVLIEDSLFAYSAKEHGAYVSDGSDDYVIRRNVFFANRASGLQCNVDPLASLEETMKNPGMRGYPRMQNTHAWAEGALRYATERFGANNFPDGRGYNFIIEDNVMNKNGRGGGAAINLAGVRESLVQNNLAYGNEASGIVLWDNANPFDAELVRSPPRTPAQMVGPQLLPTFGCYGVTVRGNTILAHTKGRPALLIGNGSWGTRAFDNVLYNESDPSIEVAPTGIYRTDAGSNVVNTVSYEGTAAALKPTALRLPDANRTVVGVTPREMTAEFERAGDEPWVVVEGGFWHLNPARPSFRPRKQGRLLAGQADRSELPPRDMTGKRRATADIGALAE